VLLEPRDCFFSQGEKDGSLFYVTKGQGKLSIASKGGKQATIALFSAGDFVGEELIADGLYIRTTTATAITHCSAFEIAKDEMMLLIQRDTTCASLFIKSLLARCIRLQTTLIDQRFNSSSKRLARVLLLMAEMGDPSQGASMLPTISQTALAEMIGATRSRVSDLMKRFSDQGFIEFNSRIRVHKSLITVLLRD